MFGLKILLSWPMVISPIKNSIQPVFLKFKPFSLSSLKIFNGVQGFYTHILPLYHFGIFKPNTSDQLQLTDEFQTVKWNVWSYNMDSYLLKLVFMYEIMIWMKFLHPKFTYFFSRIFPTWCVFWLFNVHIWFTESIIFCCSFRVRFHYGHPDVFDRLFHIPRGGISKASKGINLSEDIFAGIF